MKNWLTQMFGFSKREYNGLLFLLLLCFLVTISPSLYRYFIYNDDKANNAETVVLKKIALVDRYERKKYSSWTNSNSYAKNFKVAHYYDFDPNNASVEDWQRFGLSLKQGSSIVNYVKKGGKFYKAEDLKRMYTISPEKYEALLPYIKINTNNALEKKSTFNNYVKKEIAIIEINGADTLLLDQLKGVGPAFARRIVKYRERIGGFYAKEQLMEVFGLDTLKFNEIKDQIKVDAQVIKKININTVEFDELKNHPYLKYKQINAIIQYRKQHGPYKDIAALGKVVLLNNETLQRLAPYLKFE